jgi:hypothetical protein
MQNYEAVTMRKLLVFSLILTIFVIPVLAEDERPVLQDDASQNAWREDITTLVAGIERIHPNPYWRISEADFDAMVTALDENLPYLTRNEIVAELARIVATLDGHSVLPLVLPGADFQIYPLRLYQFSDGVFVTDAPPPYEDAIGQKVVKIGSYDIETVYEMLAPYAPFDNAMTVRHVVPVRMAYAELLQATGILDDLSQPGYVLENAAGKQAILNPAPQSLAEYETWVQGNPAELPLNDATMATANMDENFWYSYLEESQALYIQYNAVRRSTQSGQNLRDFVKELTEVMEENPVEKVILDMRYNGGGDNTTYSPLLRWIQSEEVNQPDKLFVLIGRQTFSAAANFSTEVEKSTDAVFIGEPMGGSPNLYGDVRPVTLPHSKIQVFISSRYWQKSTPDDKRDTIAPDIAVEYSSMDYFNGEDPALETALAQ